MGKIFGFLLPIMIYMILYIDLKDLGFLELSEGYKHKLIVFVWGMGFVFSIISGLVFLFRSENTILRYYSKVLNLIILVLYLIVTRFERRRK